MFGTGLIVFRETLEAALFVGIVAAATHGVAHRTRCLALGAGAGVLGSLLLAAGVDQISAWADGVGQDLLNLLILSVALCMLSWHCIWASVHGRESVVQARRLGAHASGQQNAAALWAMGVAVAMTVLREGAETVLFVSGLLSAQPQAHGSLALGVCLGLGLGLLAGGLVYAGLGRVQPRRLFAITHVLMLMLAGHLASQLARTLQQIDWLGVLNAPAWDSSAFLPNDSLPGMVLRGLVGYEASPSQLQVLFYALTTALLAWAARRVPPRVGHAALA